MLRTCPQTRCALLVLSELGVIFFLLKQKCSRAAVLHVPNDLQPSAKQRHRSACSAVLAHSTVQAAEGKSSFSTTQCCLLSSSTSSTTSLPPHSLFGSPLLTYHKAKRHSLSWTSRLRTSPKELKLQAIFCKQSCLGSKPPHLWLSCSVALPTQKHAPPSAHRICPASAAGCLLLGGKWQQMAILKHALQEAVLRWGQAAALCSAHTAPLPPAPPPNLTTSTAVPHLHGDCC